MDAIDQWFIIVFIIEQNTFVRNHLVLIFLYFDSERFIKYELFEHKFYYENIIIYFYLSQHSLYLGLLLFIAYTVQRFLLIQIILKVGFQYILL